MRRCPNCDALLNDKTVFCGNCGLKQEPLNEKYAPNVISQCLLKIISVRIVVLLQQ